MLPFNAFIENRKWKRENLQRGFTLIELVVVIGIIAILAVILIATLNPFEQFHKAQDARRKSDLAQIQKALESYYQDFGRYPATSADYKIVSNENGTGVTKDWGSNWSPYMQIIPEDNDGKYYVYNVSADGQSYWLYASIDRYLNDLQSCYNLGTTGNNTYACGNVPTNQTCGGVCTYGVSSSNVSP